MPKYITIPGFKGGIADSLFDPISKQTFQSAKNLDVVDEYNILKPLTTLTTVAPPASSISAVQMRNCLRASNGSFYFIGNGTISAVSKFILYHTTALTASPTWVQDYTANTNSGQSDAFEEFQDGLYFAPDGDLHRWGDLSGSPSHTVVSSSITNNIKFLRAHEGLGKIFFLHGFAAMIGSYDTSTVVLDALSLDSTNGVGEYAVGLEPYGSFMLVGVRHPTRKSKFIVWDGTNPTYSDVFETGEMGLVGFRVINDVIHFLCVRQMTGNNIARYYTLNPGSKPKLIKELKLGTTTFTGTDITTFESESFRHAMDASGGDFIFGLNGGTYSLLDQCIWRYGSGNQNNLLTNHRSVVSDVTNNCVFVSVKDTTDNVIVLWRTNDSSAFAIEATGISSTLNSTGVFETNAIPLNDGLPGKINRILINHKPLPTGAGFTVQIKHLGNYPWGSSVPSEDTFQDLLTPEGSGSSTGKTQSTTNTVMTEIANNPLFVDARYIQLKIKFDEISTTNGASIVFPIVLEVT